MRGERSDNFAIENNGASTDIGVAPRRLPFIEKLSVILEDEGNRGLISWSPCGELFRIYDCDEFASVVLPRYFRHSNWTSFVRQLNMYGFHKVHDNNEQWSCNNARPGNVWNFKHENFYRGATTQQLSQIKRRKPKDHSALHIQYADTMQLASSGPAETSPSPPLLFQAPSAIEQDLFERLEQKLDVLSSSFDTLFEELSELRNIIRGQNNTMKRLLPLAQRMAEPNSFNTHIDRQQEENFNHETVGQQSRNSEKQSADQLSGICDRKQSRRFNGSNEEWEDTGVPSNGAVTRKRKAQGESPKEKSQPQNHSECYSLGYILQDSPQRK